MKRRAATRGIVLAALVAAAGIAAWVVLERADRRDTARAVELAPGLARPVDPGIARGELELAARAASARDELADPEEQAAPVASPAALPLGGGLALTGRVVDETGMSPAEFSVRAIRGERSRSVHPIEDAPAVEASFRDTGGAFALTGLDEGSWVLVARAPGCFPSDAAGITLPEDRGLVELVVRRVASVAGIVVDSGGRPVADAHVTLWTKPGPSVRAESTYGKSHADGTFRIGTAPPGRIELVARKEGYVASEAVALELSGSREDVRLVLDIGGRIEGELLPRPGLASAGQQIALEPKAEVQGLFRGFHGAKTDDAGRFSIAGIAPGDYTAYLASDGSTGNPGPTGVDVSIRGTETVRVVLDPSAARRWIRVHGRVARGGAPVARMRVESGGHERGKARTDEEGRYELEVCAPGKNSFVLYLGQFSVMRLVEIPAVSEHQLDFAFGTGRIAGRLIGPDGAPLAGVRLALDGPTDCDTTSATDGEFVFQDLDPGRFEIVPEVWDETWTMMSKGLDPYVTGDPIQLELGPGGVMDGIEVRLLPAARVEGSVVTRDGKPLGRARIAVWGERAAAAGRERSSDITGRFLHPCMPAGTFTFGARKELLVSQPSAPMSVQPGVTTEVDLVAEPGTILLVVADEDDLRRMWVQVQDERGLAYGDIDNDLLPIVGAPPGRAVGPLPPGTYTVVAGISESPRKAKASVRVDGEPMREVRLELE